MPGTNFERNARLEKIMERMLTYTGEVRRLVNEFDSNSIPIKFTVRFDYLVKSMSDTQSNMKSKERPE